MRREIFVIFPLDGLITANTSSYSVPTCGCRVLGRMLPKMLKAVNPNRSLNGLMTAHSSHCVPTCGCRVLGRMLGRMLCRMLGRMLGRMLPRMFKVVNPNRSLNGLMTAHSSHCVPTCGCRMLR